MLWKTSFKSDCWHLGPYGAHKEREFECEVEQKMVVIQEVRLDKISVERGPTSRSRSRISMALSATDSFIVRIQKLKPLLTETKLGMICRVSDGDLGGDTSHMSSMARGCG